MTISHTIYILQHIITRTTYTYTAHSYRYIHIFTTLRSRGENNIYLPRGILTRINVFEYFQKRQVHFSFKTSEFFYGVFFFIIIIHLYILLFLRLLFSLCKSPKGLSFLQCHLSNIYIFIYVYILGGRFFDIFFIYLFLL